MTTMESNLNPYESERAVIGLLLKYPDKIFEVDSLRPEMFSNASFRAMFGYIKKLAIDEGIPLNSLALEEYLRSSGKLDEVGGKETIKFVSSTEANISGYSIFEKNVLDSYMARTLQELTNRVPTSHLRWSVNAKTGL